LTPTLMESLRGFFPHGASEENFFLKFSLQRDGPSLPTLLSRVRTSRHTVVAVETTDGYVFGAYCSSPWRTQAGWFGNDDSFLWRLKHPRFHERSSSRSFDRDSEIEVYPVFRNTRIQYCTSQTLAVGGGEWGKDSSGLCPYPSEPTGIGFMIDGDLMGGETNSCSTFCNPRLGQRISSKGGNEFDIRCLEVWTRTFIMFPCMPYAMPIASTHSHSCVLL
jgi:TLD